MNQSSEFINERHDRVGESSSQKQTAKPVHKTQEAINSKKNERCQSLFTMKLDFSSDDSDSSGDYNGLNTLIPPVKAVPPSHGTNNTPDLPVCTTNVSEKNSGKKIHLGKNYSSAKNVQNKNKINWQLDKIESCSGKNTGTVEANNIDDDWPILQSCRSFVPPAIKTECVSLKKEKSVIDLILYDDENHVTNTYPVHADINPDIKTLDQARPPSLTLDQVNNTQIIGNILWTGESTYSRQSQKVDQSSSQVGGLYAINSSDWPELDNTSWLKDPMNSPTSNITMETATTSSAAEYTTPVATNVSHTAAGTATQSSSNAASLYSVDLFNWPELDDTGWLKESNITMEADTTNSESVHTTPVPSAVSRTTADTVIQSSSNTASLYSIDFLNWQDLGDENGQQDYTASKSILGAASSRSATEQTIPAQHIINRNTVVTIVKDYTDATNSYSSSISERSDVDDTSCIMDYIKSATNSNTDCSTTTSSAMKITTPVVCTITHAPAEEAVLGSFKAANLCSPELSYESDLDSESCVMDFIESSINNYTSEALITSSTNKLTTATNHNFSNSLVTWSHNEASTQVASTISSSVLKTGSAAKKPAPATCTVFPSAADRVLQSSSNDSSLSSPRFSHCSELDDTSFEKDYVSSATNNNTCSLTMTSSASKVPTPVLCAVSHIARAVVMSSSDAANLCSSGLSYQSDLDDTNCLTDIIESATNNNADSAAKITTTVPSTVSHTAAETIIHSFCNVDNFCSPGFSHLSDLDNAICQMDFIETSTINNICAAEATYSTAQETTPVHQTLSHSPAQRVLSSYSSAINDSPQFSNWQDFNDANCQKYDINKIIDNDTWDMAVTDLATKVPTPVPRSVYHSAAQRVFCSPKVSQSSSKPHNLYSQACSCFPDFIDASSIKDNLNIINVSNNELGALATSSTNVTTTCNAFHTFTNSQTVVQSSSNKASLYSAAYPYWPDLGDIRCQNDSIKSSANNTCRAATVNINCSVTSTSAAFINPFFDATLTSSVLPSNIQAFPTYDCSVSIGANYSPWLPARPHGTLTSLTAPTSSRSPSVVSSIPKSTSQSTSMSILRSIGLSTFNIPRNTTTLSSYTRTIPPSTFSVAQTCALSTFSVAQTSVPSTFSIYQCTTQPIFSIPRNTTTSSSYARTIPPSTFSVVQTCAPSTFSVAQTCAPSTFSVAQTCAPSTFSVAQTCAPLTFIIPHTSAPSTFSVAQTCAPSTFSVAQTCAPLTFIIPHTSAPSTFSVAQTSVPSTFSISQRTTQPIFSMPRNTTPSAFSVGQTSASSTYSIYQHTAQSIFSIPKSTTQSTFSISRSTPSSMFSSNTKSKKRSGSSTFDKYVKRLMTFQCSYKYRLSTETSTAAMATLRSKVKPATQPFHAGKRYNKAHADNGLHVRPKKGKLVVEDQFPQHGVNSATPQPGMPPIKSFPSANAGAKSTNVEAHEKPVTHERRVCYACLKLYVAGKFVECNNDHIICKRCLKAEIQAVITTDQMNLFCPVESCAGEISLGALSMLKSSLSIDILKDNIIKKQTEASLKTLSELEGIVSCPKCSYSAQLDKEMKVFVCANSSCKVKCCRHCKAAWLLEKERDHAGCCLLYFSGHQCFSDISLLPANWTACDEPENIFSGQGFVAVPIPMESMEAITVCNFYLRTSRHVVVAVKRIQNKTRWETYVLKRKHMIEEIGNDDLNEKILFHGTTKASVDKICKEGFDFRKKTVNGESFGKGNYFSTNASYSERFAPSRSMFLARVLCGRSTKGSHQNKHPPYDMNGRMYDSCVNHLIQPTMYIVFSNEQCYPAYIIDFI